jgi:hypothetical protein
MFIEKAAILLQLSQHENEIESTRFDLKEKESKVKLLEELQISAVLSHFLFHLLA